MTLEGGCLCGSVRYACDGLSEDVAHCHCRICQRSSGAGMLTWATYPAAAVRYVFGEAAIFRSSAGAVRELCGRCGTQLIFRGDEGDTVDVTVASLDEPDLLVPKANIWVGTRRKWLHHFDTALPDHTKEVLVS
jgi:hypothetical protein